MNRFPNLVKFITFSIMCPLLPDHQSSPNGPAGAILAQAKSFGPSALLTALRFKRDWMASQLSLSRGVPAASEPEGQNNGGAGFMDAGLD